ncbi:chordin [Apostichopus japonicus]|uniref:Chordin n=1 Tax=Stichopus japonicus TaxID=307972 RepID=A0A2G8KNB1_STIJA|nr:chordin [Apostichopus japonicus]
MTSKKSTHERNVAVNGLIQGKVTCSDIKDTCVEPTCENPISSPDHCCKRCPEDNAPSSAIPSPTVVRGAGQSGDGVFRVISGMDESFASLLTQRLVASRSAGVARMSFRLRSNDLYFTMTYSRIKKPVAIVFMDIVNETLYRHEIGDQTDKVCGVWTNLPGEHLQRIRTSQIFVSITTKRISNGEVKGRIVHHRAFSAESFSTLLVTPTKRSPLNPSLGNGGIVSMSVSSDGANINLIALLDGLVESRADRGSNINITVELRKKTQTLFSSTATIDNGSRELATVLERVPKSVRKWFSRGQLIFRVSILGQTGVLAGLVTPLSTCNTLHAVLSGSQALGRQKAMGATGSAIISIARSGVVEYKILLSGLRNRQVTAITLEAETKNADRRKIIADIIDGYDGNGLAIGTYTKPKPKEIQMLLRGEVFVNVATSEYIISELRGRITQLPYNQYVNREAELPIQLSGASFSPPIATSAAGHAWMGFDEDCRLHYEIAVSGLQNEEHHAYAQMGYYNAGSAQVSRILDAFRGNLAFGIIDDIEESFMERMNEGQAFIQISTKSHVSGEIRGQVVFSSTCQQTSEVSTNLEDACYFDRLYWSSGATWKPAYDLYVPLVAVRSKGMARPGQYMTMVRLGQYMKGTIICDPIICPALDCDNPISEPGKCCATCPEEGSSTEGQGCFSVGDGTFHSVGSTWHPYFPDVGGYVRCILCTCEVGGIQNCPRVACPQTNCENPVRLNPGDCCLACPEPEPTEREPDMILQADEVENGCTFNGDFFKHGRRWTPYIFTFGRMPCITCHCNDGKATCNTIVCQELTCTKKIRRKGKCCEICADEPEEVESSDSAVEDSRSILSSIQEERRKPKS